MVRKMSRRPDWAALRDEKLLDVRLADLNLRMAGTPVEARIAQLYEELDRRGLRLKPHCWLAEEWFAADGVPGIAVPFYLAHPRLMQLERRQMLAVEGGTREECLRILRHEAGHAVESAFRLNRRRAWQDVFGRASQRYPTHYRARPSSRDFVQHLGSWYAQSHPSEDFAETFAVWLKPDGRWRRRYADWPALKKLEYVDELMHELAGRTPPVRSRETVDPLTNVRRTLREHYRRKQELYSTTIPADYRRALRRLFSDDPHDGECETAATFLRRLHRDLREFVSHVLGVSQYIVEQVLHEMTLQARRLALRRHRSERWTVRAARVMLLVQTRRFLRHGHLKLAL